MCVARRTRIWMVVKFAVAIEETENAGGDLDREILPGDLLNLIQFILELMEIFSLTSHHGQYAVLDSLCLGDEQFWRECEVSYAYSYSYPGSGGMESLDVSLSTDAAAEATGGLEDMLPLRGMVEMGRRVWLESLDPMDEDSYAQEF
ncbi:hypothetical protein HGM15179_003209 [Zosterops borbonicus]|uniref:Uncharacterized protein n=1 Tax=Zosterops borbonicus TaxID=364589 RepID=A0A8K1GSD6_9PASS|nr:hypothetical protein HGM15179_003209 [Zosterops borbonicus]